MQKFILYFLLLSTGYSQSLFPILGGQRAGTSVFSFLNIGVSARAVGMGESVVALSQDAASIYYNPAIMAQLNQTEISISQIQWPAEIKYDYFSFTRNIFGRNYLIGGKQYTKATFVRPAFAFTGSRGNLFHDCNTTVGFQYTAVAPQNSCAENV